MEEIVRDILKATKVSDLTDILERLNENHNTAWRPVGDQKNNLATINLGSDPASGLIERVTNAIDAVFEKKWLENGKPKDIKSPRIASQEWFNIPKGKLSNIEDANNPAIKEAADNVVISYRDSDQSEKPTVDIRDYGIGIKSGDYKDTILSLHGDTKLNKLFLAGAYGQGGSTAISYSVYTIIVSHPCDYIINSSEEDEISFTIVRHDPKDYERDKHGTYEYLVEKKTKNPFSCNAGKVDFEPGTLVRHVSMELGKYSGSITAPSRGLWYLVHHYLFDPVMPYWIQDQRGKGDVIRRRVTGNNRLLSTTDYLEYSNEIQQTFKSGKVKIKWWVLNAEGKKPKDRIRHYTLASKPIVITFNGQKQGELPNTIIKKDLSLPYLEKYLIVQIDCDKLDGETRRNLFPTTRESIRESFIAEDLRQLVKETLAGDEQLEILNENRKKRYLQRVDSSTIDNIRKRLAKRVSSSILAGGTGNSPTVLPPRNNKKKTKDRPKIPIQQPPTFIEIQNSEPLTVYPGRRFTIKFKTDADPAYFVNPESFIAVLEPPNLGRYSGTTNIFEGYGTSYFKVDEDASPGDEINILLEVRPKNHHSISDEVKATVEEFPDTGDDRGNKSTPNINPYWIDSEDELWYDEDWTENNVALVREEPDEINVFVSAENKLLNKLISRAQRHDEEAVDAIKDFYLEHISYYAILAHMQNDKLMSNSSNGVDPEFFERKLEAEFMNACDTVCGIIGEMFNLIIEE